MKRKAHNSKTLRWEFRQARNLNVEALNGSSIR